MKKAHKCLKKFTNFSISGPFWVNFETSSELARLKQLEGRIIDICRPYTKSNGNPSIVKIRGSLLPIKLHKNLLLCN